jgi:uncharacterized membrane protein YczE
LPIQQVAAAGWFYSFHLSEVFSPRTEYGMMHLMLKSIHWKTFPRDFFIAQVGFAIFGLAIAIIIQADLGTGPWAVFAVALADQFGTTPGTMVIITGLVVLAGAITLGEKVGWGTLANIIFIGPWLDFFLSHIPPLTGNLPLQIAALMGAILLSGIATAVYISVNAGAGPRDSLMLAVSRVSGWSVRLSRVVIETLVVVLGWILSGPVGIGTLTFALLIGPTIQGTFKLFKVKPHQLSDRQL